MTRAARLLYIGVNDKDFPILAKYVRPAPNTEIRTLTIAETNGYPQAVAAMLESFGSWKADAVIYSPYMAHPEEIEAMIEHLLSPDAP